MHLLYITLLLSVSLNDGKEFPRFEKGHLTIDDMINKEASAYSVLRSKNLLAYSDHSFAFRSVKFESSPTFSPTILFSLSPLL